MLIHGNGSTEVRPVTRSSPKMAFMLRIRLLSLWFFTFNLKLCTSHPGAVNYVSLPGMIAHSIRTAVNELSIKERLEKHHFLSGNDRKLSDGSMWHHSRFMFSGERGKVAQLSDKAYVTIRATKELLRITNVRLKVLQTDPKVVRMWRKSIAPYCNYVRPRCNPKNCYRTADGTCNNLAHTTWGSSMTPQLRYLPAVYADGINTPRLFSVRGQPLPSSRLISNVLHSTGVCNLDNKGHSMLLMTWGQFIDHDFIGTPMTKGFNNSDIMCCSMGEAAVDQRGSCFPIKVPYGDPHFRKKCMDFVRSTIAPNHYCDMDVRNPLNQHTSYIDASLMYGSTQNQQNRLRAGFGGFLKMTFRGMMPPTDGDMCMTSSPLEYCFDAGDDRNSVVPTLAAIHTIFVREHNRICKQLQFYNPFWSDETLFQESRKIMSAVLQHVTYTEYLPLILSDVHMKTYGLYSEPKGHHTVYNPKVNPTASNVFGVAAFRFGHSQIPNLQGMMDPHSYKTRSTPIEFTFNRPAMIFSDNGKGCERVAYWELNSRQAQPDRFLQNGVRNNLFLDKKGDSFDLASLNIQRGRDHGIPAYNAWRKWCGLKPAYHFGTGPGGLEHHDAEAAILLSQLYKHPDDIDMFSGGISEVSIKGSQTGPTFACIIAKQFQFFKEGDRFWYENKFPSIGFTKDQLNEIKKVRLSRIMCNNMKIRQIQSNAFFVPSYRNRKIGCKSLPNIDLRHWIEDKGKGTSSPHGGYYGGPGRLFSSEVMVPYNPVSFWTYANLPRDINRNYKIEVY